MEEGFRRFADGVTGAILSELPEKRFRRQVRAAFLRVYPESSAQQISSAERRVFLSFQEAIPKLDPEEFWTDFSRETVQLSRKQILGDQIFSALVEYRIRLILQKHSEAYSTSFSLTQIDLVKELLRKLDGGPTQFFEEYIKKSSELLLDAELKTKVEENLVAFYQRRFQIEVAKILSRSELVAAQNPEQQTDEEMIRINAVEVLKGSVLGMTPEEFFQNLLPVILKKFKSDSTSIGKMLSDIQYAWNAYREPLEELKAQKVKRKSDKPEPVQNKKPPQLSSEPSAESLWGDFNSENSSPDDGRGEKEKDEGKPSKTMSQVRQAYPAFSYSRGTASSGAAKDVLKTFDIDDKKGRLQETREKIKKIELELNTLCEQVFSVKQKVKVEKDNLESNKGLKIRETFGVSQAQLEKISKQYAKAILQKSDPRAGEEGEVFRTNQAREAYDQLQKSSSRFQRFLNFWRMIPDLFDGVRGYVGPTKRRAKEFEGYLSRYGALHNLEQIDSVSVQRGAELAKDLEDVQAFVDAQSISTTHAENLTQVKTLSVELERERKNESLLCKQLDELTVIGNDRSKLKLKGEDGKSLIATIQKVM